MTVPHPAASPTLPRREKAALEQGIKESRRAILVVNTRSRQAARAYAKAKRLLTIIGVVAMHTGFETRAIGIGEFDARDRGIVCRSYLLGSIKPFLGPDPLGRGTN